jgi:integrase
MKGQAGTERELVVPLSDAMVAVLRRLSPNLSRLASALVFPNPGTGRPTSADSVLDVIQAIDAGVTTHGFRSSFMDWGRDQGYPRETLKLALAQMVGSKLDQSYARDTLVEHRRPIMQAWGVYCSGVLAVLGERAAA